MSQTAIEALELLDNAYPNESVGFSDAHGQWVEIGTVADMRSTLASYTAALSALTQGGVKVKELEWVKPPLSETLSRCDTELGTYRVWTHHEANGTWFWSLEGGCNEVYGEANSESDAKSAAQQDYATRIRSVITLQREPVPEPYDNDAVWAAFYRDGKTLLEIAVDFKTSVYGLSPWLMAPLTRATLAHQPVTAGWTFSANEGELLFEVPGRIVVSIEDDGIGYTILRGDKFEAGKFEQSQIDDLGQELTEALAALKSEGRK